MAEPLSPAAQAIVAAFDDRYELLGPLEDNWQEVCLVAALRALADAVVPEETSIVKACEFRRQRQRTRKQILSIATELENTNEH